MGLFDPIAIGTPFASYLDLSVSLAGLKPGAYRTDLKIVPTSPANCEWHAVEIRRWELLPVRGWCGQL